VPKAASDRASRYPYGSSSHRPSSWPASTRSRGANARIFWSAFSFQFGFDGLPGSFDSRDFDGPANFRVESSFLGTYVLQIDGVRIYDALSGHLRRRDRYASN
jgi:hypothetical protein